MRVRAVRSVLVVVVANACALVASCATHTPEIGATQTRTPALAPMKTAPAGGRTDNDRTAAQALVDQASAAAEAGEGPRAFADFERALRLDPSAPRAHVGWALAGELVGADPAIIEAHLRAATRLEPDDPSLHTLLGTWLLSRQAAAEAVACFDDALVADPRYVEAHARRADVLAQGGDLPGAVAGYRAALRADPAFVPALVGLADTAERLGDGAAARGAHEALIRLFPDATLYRARLISFYRRTGQGARADKLERELAQKVPKDTRRLRPLRR